MSHPEKIGKYEILDKIGEGGFGVVYKGRDPFIKRLVAVKTCTSEEQGIQKRFFLEAEIAGNLHHDNVVTIHDFGIQDETPYLVQEYLEGEDLDLLISRADPELSLRDKVRCLRGIAEGLGYAHLHGVVHRDVKPSNIRVLGGGRVKVMDFGIAKLKDQESRLTATGMTVGTVAYLSPEQLRGEPVDHRADIFSFGVVAYELLSGERPFRGDSIEELFHRLLSTEPPPLDESRLAPGLSSMVQRCLAKDPEDRYQRLSEVVALLDEIRESLPGDPDETDPFWGGTPSSSSAAGLTARLAAEAHRAIENEDLTAAEMTLNIARREIEKDTFEREFGSLLADLEALKERLEASARSSHRIDDDERAKVDAALDSIRAQLDARALDEAAIALVALEQRHPGLRELEPLHDRIARMTRRRLRRERSGSAARPETKADGAEKETAVASTAADAPSPAGTAERFWRTAKERLRPALDALGGLPLEPWQWALIATAAVVLVGLLVLLR